MVKNTTGGSGAKSLARKLTSSSSSSVPLPASEDEVIAIVSKIHGAHCDVLLHNGSKLICHIRNKFRGRNKRQNVLTVGSFVLTAIRSWQSDSSHSDLLFVYDSAPNFSPLPSLEPSPSHTNDLFCNNDLISSSDNITYSSSSDYLNLELI
jgi:translation initiation factor IF-1